MHAQPTSCMFISKKAYPPKTFVTNVLYCSKERICEQGAITRVATFLAIVSQLRSGGWSTQLSCSTLFVAAWFLQPKRAPFHIRLASKTALGKISNKQLCYLCKASGAGCFCMHRRISLSLDSLRNLKQPLKHDTLHPTYKEDTYFCLFSHKRDLNFIICYYFSFTQSWSNLTTLLKDETMLLSKRSLRREHLHFFPVVDFFYLKFYLSSTDQLL